MMRTIYLTFGCLSLILGVIGIILPLLPTTPFLLLSSFCFARSSQKFHKWLLSHAYFGPIITDWNNHGRISKRSKLSAIIVIISAFGISLLIGASTLVLTIQAIVLSLVSVFILTCPHGEV